MKYPALRSEKIGHLMPVTTAHTNLQIDAAPAATISTRGQGFEWERLSGSVIALAARCAQ